MRAWCRLREAGARLGDLVLMTEVQEILRRDVVSMLRRCESLYLPARLDLVSTVSAMGTKLLSVDV